MIDSPYTPEDVLRGMYKAFPEQAAALHDRPRASMLAGCARENAYYISGTNVSNPGEERYLDSKFTQEQGRLAEDLTVAAIAELGHVRVVNRQIELSDGSMVSGHPDGELEYLHNDTWGPVDNAGLKWGWEHKHFGRFGYKEIAEKGLWSAAPDIIIQTALYGMDRAWDACSVVITAQDASSMKFELRKMRSKANPKMMVFTLDLRNEVYPLLSGPLKARADALKDVQRGIIKPADVVREYSSRDNFPCGYCDFQTRCQQDGAGTVALPQLPLRRV